MWNIPNYSLTFFIRVSKRKKNVQREGEGTGEKERHQMASSRTKRECSGGRFYQKKVYNKNKKNVDS